jgi:hypothetical protein
MGATYTRQSSYTDGDIITAAHTNDEFNQLLAAFAASTGHTHDGTTAEGGPITKLLGTAITIGDGTAGTDITVTYDGESNDGVMKWMEDEDYFEFSDDILIASTEKLQFRDTAIYINSSADGQLDIVADTEVQIAAPTIDINGDADVSGTLTYGSLSDGSITITAFVDEDDMTSDSATLVPTQQSVKAYVDAQVTAQDLDFQADTGGALNIDLDSETLTLTGGTGIDTSGSGNAVTFAIDSTVATLTGTQTLTNKTLTTPVISTISNTGTVTLPTATDTLVARATTDTLTNKTINTASNTITVVEADISDLQSYILAGSTDTLTNKTIDVDNNTVSNIEVDNFKASAVVIESEGIGSNDNDTTLPTSAAVKDYVDTQVATANELSELTDVNLTSPATSALIFYNSVTGEWADAVVSGDFTISSGGVGAIASGVVVNADINASAAIDATKIHDGTVSNTEFGYLNGVTSAIQTQLDAKQASDAQLDDIAGLTPTDGNFIVGDGTNFVTESAGTARTSLGLGSIATQDNGSVDINGGNIDGTVIGAALRSSAQFTTLQVQSTSTLEGTLNLNDDLDMGDNNKIRLGTSDDFEIYHDGTNSRINDAGTGSLKLQSANTDRIIVDSNVTIQGLVYPSSDGSNGQVLTTNGSGTLSFQAVTETDPSALAFAIALG